MGNQEYISIGTALNDRKYLKGLVSYPTAQRLCREGILFAMKFGDNRKGRGHWKILTSSIAQYRIHQTDL